MMINKLNPKDVIMGLTMLLDSTPKEEVFIRARIQEQIDWFSIPVTFARVSRTAGAHFGQVRNWMQWNCINGSDISFGSDDVLQPKRNWTPKVLEEIACEVAVGVINELKGL